MRSQWHNFHLHLAEGLFCTCCKIVSIFLVREKAIRCVASKWKKESHFIRRHHVIYRKITDPFNFTSCSELVTCTLWWKRIAGDGWLSAASPANVRQDVRGSGPHVPAVVRVDMMFLSLAYEVSQVVQKDGAVSGARWHLCWKIWDNGRVSVMDFFCFVMLGVR
jgi:hypothetical protein